jgi:hypothetical protein
VKAAAAKRVAKAAPRTIAADARPAAVTTKPVAKAPADPAKPPRRRIPRKKSITLAPVPETLASDDAE